MKSFTDAKGREWNFTLGVKAVRDLKRTTGVDLLSLATNEPNLSSLFLDDLWLLDQVAVLLGDQFKALKVTKEQFEEGLDGTGIEAVRKALLAEIDYFFPEERAKLLLKVGETFRDRMNKILAPSTPGESSPDSPPASPAASTT